MAVDFLLECGICDFVEAKQQKQNERTNFWWISLVRDLGPNVLQYDDVLAASDGIEDSLI